MLIGRHGLSVHNVENKGVFDYGDPSLVYEGHAQWAEVGRNVLAGRKLGVVALSPSRRVRQSFGAASTAAPFKARQRVINPAFSEYDWGEWSGTKIHAAFTRDVQKQANTEGVHFCPPGGESIYEKGAAMLEGLAQIKGDVGLLLSSGMALKAMIGVALDMSREDILGFHIAPGEILEWDPKKAEEPTRKYIPRQYAELQMAA